MYVCLCKAVTERTVRSLIRSGADSRESIARSCGAGTDCGGCRGAIDEMLEDEADARSCGGCAGTSGVGGHAPAVFVASPPAA